MINSGGSNSYTHGANSLDHHRERSVTMNSHKNTPINHSSVEAFQISKTLFTPSNNHVDQTAEVFHLIKERISGLKTVLDGKDDSEKIKELYKLLVNEITTSTELQMKLDNISASGKETKKEKKENDHSGSKKNNLQAINLPRITSSSPNIVSTIEINTANSSPSSPLPSSDSTEKTTKKGRDREKEDKSEKRTPPTLKFADIGKSDSTGKISGNNGSKSARFTSSSVIHKSSSGSGSTGNLSKEPSPSLLASIESNNDADDKRVKISVEVPTLTFESHQNDDEDDRFESKSSKKKGQSLTARKRKDKIVSVMNLDYNPGENSSPNSPNLLSPSSPQVNSENLMLKAKVADLTKEIEALKAKMNSIQSVAKEFESRISSLCQ